jgi:hypothetical protein
LVRQAHLRRCGEYLVLARRRAAPEEIADALVLLIRFDELLALQFLKRLLIDEALQLQRAAVGSIGDGAFFC